MKVVEYRPIARGFKALGEGPHLAEILRAGLTSLKDLPLWVSSGTLLGLYRDGRFIPSDTDIDVGVRVESDIYPEDIISALSPMKLHRQLTWNGRVQQLAFIAEPDTVFDVYFYYPEGDRLTNHNTCCVLDKPADLFLPIIQWTSPVGVIPAPNNLEVYCKMRYGPTWKTPSCKKGIYGNDF